MCEQKFDFYANTFYSPPTQTHLLKWREALQIAISIDSV